MSLPTLVVVTGPPASGKTTLAQALARAVPCPAICRDEIKEGMAFGEPDFVPAPGDALTRRTLPVFFDVLRVVLTGGVTVVAEAAFQDKLWRPGLEPLAELATFRIVRCHASDEVRRQRAAQRSGEVAARAAHADREMWGTDGAQEFVPLDMPAPTIDVDTTEGYQPPLEAVLDFIRSSADG